jgi:uncharacterized membrane protein
MPKKYDTNPLDPEFPQKAREAQAEAFPRANVETDRFAPPSITEEQTRRFDEANFASYSPPFGEGQMPAEYRAAQPFADVGKSSSRKVAKIGLPENILTALPYVPFYIGLIAGILILLFVPRSETKVRFHAAQGLAAHIGILIISSILGGVGHIANFANIGSGIFTVVTMIMLIIWTIKAFRGKPVHIESVDDLTNWLDDKISPRD